MAALKLLNDFTESVDNKQHCAALFIDLSKHLILLVIAYCYNDLSVLDYMNMLLVGLIIISQTELNLYRQKVLFLVHSM